MSHKEQDWLDNAFIDYKEDYISDDGFTDMLMASLPPEAAKPVALTNQSEASTRYDWLVIGSATAASVVAASLFPLSPFVDLLTASAQIPVVIAGVAALGATLMLGTSLVRKAL